MINSKRENKIPIKYLISILFVFSSVFLSAMTGLFVVAWIVAFVSGYYLSTLNVQREKILFSIVLLLVFQNPLIGIGSHLLGNTTGLNYLTQVPLMYVLGIFIGLNPLKIKFDSVTKLFALLLITILFSTVFGHGAVGSILANLRNLTFFYIVYQIVILINNDNFSIERFNKNLSKISLLIVVVGIILLLGGYDLYNSIGINEVYSAKGVRDVGAISGQLDGRFYSDLFGYKVSRMGSLYYEPVNLGYLMVGIFLFLVSFKWTNSLIEKKFYETITLIGVFLSFGKGSFLILLLALLSPFIHDIFKSSFYMLSDKWIFKIVISIVTIGVYIFSNWYYRFYGGAVGNHFIAISQTWANIVSKPLGYGIGTGGNAAELFNEGTSSDWFSTGGETALLSFGYQLGIIGMVLLIFIFISISMKNLTELNCVDSIYRNRILMVSYLPIIIVIVSIFQDNTFSPQCITIYMFLLAAEYIYEPLNKK